MQFVGVYNIESTQTNGWQHYEVHLLCAPSEGGNLLLSVFSVNAYAIDKQSFDQIVSRDYTK